MHELLAEQVHPPVQLLFLPPAHTLPSLTSLTLQSRQCPVLSKVSCVTIIVAISTDQQQPSIVFHDKYQVTNMKNVAGKSAWVALIGRKFHEIPYFLFKSLACHQSNVQCFESFAKVMSSDDMGSIILLKIDAEMLGQNGIFERTHVK